MKPAPYKFDMQVHVKDEVTGFKGHVMGRVQYITGCNQYLIQPKAATDGKYPDSTWLDENRLSLTKTKAVTLPGSTKKARDRGACGEAPIK